MKGIIREEARARSNINWPLIELDQSASWMSLAGLHHSNRASMMMTSLALRSSASKASIVGILAAARHGFRCGTEPSNDPLLPRCSFSCAVIPPCLCKRFFFSCNKRIASGGDYRIYSMHTFNIHFLTTHLEHTNSPVHLLGAFFSMFHLPTNKRILFT